MEEFGKRQNDITRSVQPAILGFKNVFKIRALSSIHNIALFTENKMIFSRPLRLIAAICFCHGGGIVLNFAPRLETKLLFDEIKVRLEMNGRRRQWCNNLL